MLHWTLFAAQGYGATSIAAIAREAGVVPETIYASLRLEAGDRRRPHRNGSPRPRSIGGSPSLDWEARAGDPVGRSSASSPGFATEVLGEGTRRLAIGPPSRALVTPTSPASGREP